MCRDHHNTLHEGVRHAVEVERSHFRERVTIRFSRLDQSRVEALVYRGHAVRERIGVRPLDRRADSDRNSRLHQLMFLIVVFRIRATGDAIGFGVAVSQPNRLEVQ